MSTSPDYPIQTLILNAFRNAGITARPLTGLSNEEQIEGLDLLNCLIDSWGAEELVVWYRPRIVFPINANQQEYIIGQDVSMGVPDFIYPRPQRIDRASYIFTNTAPPQIEQPFDILIEQQWASLSPKGLTSTIATKLYYEARVPNGAIFLWPIPTQSAQMALYLWSVLQQISGVTDSIFLPPAYRLALETNLAIMLAPRYGKQPTPAILAQARASKAALKNINHEPLLMQAEMASMGVTGRDGYYGRYNILSNTYWGLS